MTDTIVEGSSRGVPQWGIRQAKAKRKRGEQEEIPSNLPIAKESSPANLTERSETIGSGLTDLIHPIKQCAANFCFK